MTPAETLKQHQILCDEIHQLALEENRFLKQNQRVPDAAFLERKRALLGRLDSSVSAIRELNQLLQPGASATTLGLEREGVERLRARIMQIMHLDRENEQLLFRYSLSAGPKAAPAAPPPSRLQQLYGGVLKKE